MKFLSAIQQDAKTIYTAVNPWGFPSLEVTPTYRRIMLFFVRFISRGGRVMLFIYLTSVLIYPTYVVLCAFASYLRPLCECLQP